MKKFTLFAIAMLIAGSFASTGWAGDVKTGGQSLSINGEVNMDAVWRNDQIDNVLNNPSAEDRSSDGFVDIEVTLDLSWQFTDRVGFMLQLENAQTNSANYDGAPGTFGRVSDNSTGAFDGGSGGLYDRDPSGSSDNDSTGSINDEDLGNFGTDGGFAGNTTGIYPNTDFGGENIVLDVEQAYITVDQLIWEWLNAKVGLFDVNYDLRGDGSSFLYNLNERFPETFGGVWARATFDNWYVEGTAGTLVEDRLQGASDSSSGVRNNRRETTDLWILHGQYNFDENKGKLFAQLSGVVSDGNSFVARNDFFDPQVPGAYDYRYTNVHNNIITAGFGGLYNFTDWFELYGEGYWQFGEAGVELPAGTDVSDGAGGTNPLFGGGTTLVASTYPDEASAEGFGGRIGMNLHWNDMAWKPWVDVSFWYTSGDENGDVDGTDDDEQFHIWGNHNSSYIVEGIDYGYGINTNYYAVKVKAGITGPEKDAMFEDWAFDALFAWYQVTETDKYRNATEGSLFPDPALAPQPLWQEATSDLGFEVDLTAKYHYSDNLTFTWGAGFLWSSDFIAENYTSTDNGSERTALPLTAAEGAAAVEDGEDFGTILFMDITLKF